MRTYWIGQASAAAVIASRRFRHLFGAGVLWKEICQRCGVGSVRGLLQRSLMSQKACSCSVGVVP